MLVLLDIEGTVGASRDEAVVTIHSIRRVH